MARPIILVVDDEPLILRSIARILESLPCDCVTFESAEEARSKVADLGSSLRLALIDQNLKGTKGLDLGRELRDRCPGLRVILFSGAPIGGECEFPVLPKPFSDKDLLAKVLREITS